MHRLPLLGNKGTGYSGCFWRGALSAVPGRSARLCDPMGCSPPGSSDHGILQARVLEWVAMPLQGIFPTQGLNPGLPALQADSLLREPPGK